MDYTERLTLSYYKTIAVLNEAHQVFLVQHRQTDQICVKKVLSIYNPEIFRFLREHPIPGTPGILALWEEDGMLTVLEEYISGITLEERMRNAPLTPEEVFSYFSELCDIAERLHQCKPPIIHRDIKPSNIMLTSCGHLVLLDFNAAKSFHGPAAADTTRLGTQGYAAPEQHGFGASSPQTDLYAMGVLLREMSRKLCRYCGRQTFSCHRRPVYPAEPGRAIRLRRRAEAGADFTFAGTGKTTGRRAAEKIFRQTLSASARISKLHPMEDVSCLLGLYSGLCHRAYTGS